MKSKYKDVRSRIESPSEIGQITAAAALAHDIGNPPFGHVGERAIRDWFASKKDIEIINLLTEDEKQDFFKFEGNAQRFRILTRLANNNVGLKLSAATLGAYTKYPTPSGSIEEKGYIGQKKNGYFCDDKDAFHLMRTALGLKKITAEAYQRHPLAFLVEAADDICYRIIDLEDGWKMGRISFDDATACLVKILPNKDTIKINTNCKSREIGRLRAKAIDNLVKEVIEAFNKNEECIKEGRLNQDLISMTCLASAMDQAKKIAEEKIFSWDRIQMAELAGIRMIHRLLDDLVGAIELPDSEIGRRARCVMGEISRDARPYYKLLAVTDYISGMTDRYLVDSFHRFSGSRID